MSRLGHALLATGVALGVLAGCSSGGSTKDSSTASSTTTTTRVPAGATATKQSAANTVTIKGYSFKPASLTVKVGTEVTWENQDSVEHTVTAIPGDTLMFDGTVPGGSSYKYRLTRTGSFPYVCQNHPGMSGTIIVTG